MNVLVLLALVLLPVNAWAVSDIWDRQIGVVVDTLVKTGAGVLHSVTCAGDDAAATAGAVAIRDGVAAAGGTVIQNVNFAAAYFPPVTLIFDVRFSTGLYLDFTTTGDVACSVSYR